MTAPLRHPSCAPSARQPALPPGTRVLLNRLRMEAATCRASARLDLFEACTLLSPDPKVASEARMRTLIRTLAQALGRAPVFHRPGAATVSFDEAWLTSLLAAQMRGDADSATFLLHSRIAADKRGAFCRLLVTLVRFLTD